MADDGLGRPIITITSTCVRCQAIHSVRMVKDAYQAWQDGMLLQDACPELDAGEREFLISRTCQACWAALFPPEEDANDD